MLKKTRLLALTSFGLLLGFSPLQALNRKTPQSTMRKRQLLLLLKREKQEIRPPRLI